MTRLGDLPIVFASKIHNQNKRIMNATKEDMMVAIATKLQDILNSQEALIEKTAEVQIDLMSVSDAELERAIVEIHTAASANFDAIQQAIEKYQAHIDALKS